MPKRAKTTELFERVRGTLPPVFDEMLLQEAIGKLRSKDSRDDDLSEVMGHVERLDLKWNSKVLRQLYSFDPSHLVPIDVASAWTRKSGVYLSHNTALFFHGLIEQNPWQFTISVETASHSNASKKPLNVGLMEMAFMQGPRLTQNFATFGRAKFFFVERANCGDEGLLTTNLITPRLDVRVTDLERTLLDSFVNPHYAGGMLVVLEALQKATVDLEKLHRQYVAANLLYPYWQRVGFAFEAVGLNECATRWASFFPPPNVDFYFDRNFRQTWNYSDKWRLFYPKGLGEL
jgi:predicted transcriptional regulator of viral defense system